MSFRAQVFSALEERLAQGAGYISSAELASFDVAGEPRRLIANSKGIWNPRDLDSTLSVVSSADGPYADEEISPGVWRYDYEAGSIHGSNTKLRRAMETSTPIILLRKIATGVYVPHFPVYVVADSPAERFFTLAIDDVVRLRDPDEPDARRYAERVVKQRVHQPEFRGKVLLAYENRCAVCRLRHPELLDAAHILPDSHPQGRPVVTNGLSLCKIHHGAYDSNFLGIDPDYQVHINSDLLLEKDGPMLKHGLQEMHGSTLEIPRQRAKRPSRDGLAERFERFVQAG
jgi:putative restriction endonuclease